MRKAILFLILMGTLTPPLRAQSVLLTDSEVRRNIIKESLSHFSGKCPCPYSRQRSGRICGESSAYKKSEDSSHICFPEDVSDEMVLRYRATH